MPSGLVFVAIVVIWAVILAPRVVRLYEQGTSQRTTRRFRSAMTVLGRSQQDRVRTIHTSRRSATERESPLPQRRTGGRQAPVRRRRTLLVLSLLSAGGVVAGVLGFAPMWLAAVAAVPVMAFLLACARLPLSGANQPAESTEEPPGPLAAPPLPATRRFVPHGQGFELAATDMPTPLHVTAFRARSAVRAHSRRGSWSRAQELATRQIQEQESALAATYNSAEEQLGLEQYVNSPSGVDGLPYRRAANG